MCKSNEERLQTEIIEVLIPMQHKQLEVLYILGKHSVKADLSCVFQNLYMSVAFEPHLLQFFFVCVSLCLFI